MPRNPPLCYRWNGEAFEVLPRFQKMADRQFVVGEVYLLEEVQERSIASHNHQFACLHDAWLSLPEKYSDEPWAQSPEHLRKYALIKAGFCYTDTFACATRAEAMRLARILRSDDEYCIVSVQGSVVHRFRAESQSKRAMGAERFQKSKQAVLDFVSGLLDVPAQADARRTQFALEEDDEWRGSAEMTRDPHLERIFDNLARLSKEGARIEDKAKSETWTPLQPEQHKAEQDARFIGEARQEAEGVEG